MDWISTGMMGLGLGHWIVMILALGLVLYPVGRILARLGFSPLLSILAILPLVNLAALWILAFIDWPKRGHTGADRGSV